MRIEKKCWPKLFQKIAVGEKKFDVRLADFKCEPGDTLILREWNPKTKAYTGRVLRKKVAFVLRTKDLKFWTAKDIKKYGLQIISF